MSVITLEDYMNLPPDVRDLFDEWFRSEPEMVDVVEMTIGEGTAIIVANSRNSEGKFYFNPEMTDPVTETRTVRISAPPPAEVWAHVKGTG